MAYRDLLARLAGAQGLGVDLGLERMRQALGRLGDPHRALPAAVQIAGTNGKGSTAAMTEAILRAAGLRTGLYTSPHLCRFTERIRIDGREADGDWLSEQDLRVAATGVPLTYFEIATAVAFLAMAAARVEVAVLETGLGGRLDAVTAAEPSATAITSIGLDHTAYLGDTIAAIAREKAGILKPGVPCFLGRVPADAEVEIARVAAAVGAPLARLGHDFEAPSSKVGLRGAHQQDNAAIAVALARTAAAHLGRPLDDPAIAVGLERVVWPGRLERLAEDLLVDCAHNEEGARVLAAAVPPIAAGRRVVLVVSIVRDKDPAGILRVLAPVADAVVTTRSPNRRALTATALAAAAGAFHRHVAPVEDPDAALVEARRRAGPKGLVVVCGSTFVVGHLRARLLGEAVDPEPTADPV